MIYRTHNLTGCLVVLKSEASMRQFLRDRQRAVESKMRKAIKAGGFVRVMRWRMRSSPKWQNFKRWGFKKM